MTKRTAVLFSLLLQLPPAAALVCPTGSVLKQTEGPGGTLHSWCEKDGHREGPYEVFAINGGIQVDAHFHNGKLDGKFKRFDAQGNLETDGQYQNGQMDGLWTRYWNKQTMRDQGHWKKGLPIGTWKFVDKKTGAENVVKYDRGGKIEKPRDLDDRWRYTTGYIHTERYGYYRPGRNNDDNYSVNLLAVDAERRILQWKRYLRVDLTARLLPERMPESEDVVLSGQAGISLDVLRNLTGPVAFYMRMGPHFTDFDKSHFFFGLGLRYHLKRYKPGTYFSGFFLELGHVDYESDRKYQNYGGPGQSDNDGDAGLDTFYTGVFWSAF